MGTVIPKARWARPMMTILQAIYAVLAEESDRRVLVRTPRGAMALAVFVVGERALAELTPVLRDFSDGLSRPPGGAVQISERDGVDEVLERLENAGWVHGCEETEALGLPVAVWFFIGPAVCQALAPILQERGFALPGKEGL